MKKSTICGLVLGFLAVLSAASVHANVGDVAVYNNLGDASLTPAAGESVVNTFTNTVVAPAAAYELLPSGDGVQMKHGGKHLVMYNVRFDRTNSSKYRGEMLTHLTLENESSTNALAYGRAQGFIRNENDNNEAVISGGSIIQTSAGDILRLHSTRSDANTGLDVIITPGHTAIQLLKLDDSLDCLQLRRSNNSGAIGPAAFTPVTWDTIDEIPASGSMSYIGGTESITLSHAGYYLIFANTHLLRSDSRELTGTASNGTRTGATGRMTLNGQPIEGTFTTTYLRGNANDEECDDGTLCAANLIKAQASDVLKVEHKRQTGVNYILKGEKTALTIIKMPSTIANIRLQDMTGANPVYNDLNQGLSGTDESLCPPVSVKFRTQNEPPSAVFTHTTNDLQNSRITINQSSRYLFIGGYFDDDDGSERICPNPQWAINGTTLSYGECSQYSRNDQVHDNGNWLGMVSALASNSYVEMTSRRLGNSGEISGDSLALQALDIATITDSPVLIFYGPMAITTNSSAVIRPHSLLTRDTNSDPSALIYTITSTPANALLHKEGAPLSLNDTFTQADVNDGKITVSAESTIGNFDVFDFTVSDGGSQPSIATFSILASAGVTTEPDSGSTTEDEILTLLDDDVDSVLSNDLGVAIFVRTCDNVSELGAAVTVNSDGTFSYDPGNSLTLQALQNGQSTNDTFSYTVEDFAGLTGEQTVTITVSGTNDTFAALADCVNEPSVTETGAVSLAINLTANDGITATTNGDPENRILPINYSAEFIDTPNFWYNTGTDTQEYMNWRLGKGCQAVSISSAYAGISHACNFDGSEFAYGTLGEGVVSSIQNIAAGDPDEASATFEMWIRPDPAALLQTNILFETGGGTGMGIVLAKGILQVANGIEKGLITYDLLNDPRNLLLDDITNEFAQIVFTINMETPMNELYINGELIDIAFNNNASDWDGGDGAGIGHFGGNNVGGFMDKAAGTSYDTWYNGDIAAFRIYTEVLNSTRIRENYRVMLAGDATDIDGDTITVAGVYDASGTLIGGTGTPLTLTSGATLTYDPITGSFTYDPTGNPDIAALWDGETYLDSFVYQATDSNGCTSDAPVQICVHGVSQYDETILPADELRPTILTPGELMRAHQPHANPLNPAIALYTHPDKVVTSPENATIWKTPGTLGSEYDAVIDFKGLAPVASGFGGIGYALVNNFATLNTFNPFSTQDQSWEVWFRPDPDAVGNSVIMKSGGTTYGTLIYYNAERNSVNVIVDCGDDNDPDQNMIAEIGGVRWDEFNQVIAIFEFASPGQPDTLRVYLNNDPNAAFNTANSVIVTNPSGKIDDIVGTDPTAIGRMHGSGVAFNLECSEFKGAIAHTLVYDKVLNEDEAATAYNRIRKPLVAVQNGATALGASVSLTNGAVSYDGQVTNDIAYGAVAADSFTYQFIDDTGATASATAPLAVHGTGATLTLNDTLVLSANSSATNFNPLLNDSGLGSGAVILTNSVIIADYRDDYPAGTVSGEPADFRDGSGFGWQYLWNAPTNWVFGEQYDGASGAITETDCFRHLLWSDSDNWRVDSDNLLTNGSPGEYLHLHSTGGHPGSGWNTTDMQPTYTNYLNRYAIAAYTVAESGSYNIIESMLYTDSSADGIDLIVMVNDTVIEHNYLGKALTADFDTDLGELAVGDTIYVGIGPNAHRQADGFQLDFSIARRAAADAQELNIIGELINNLTDLTYNPSGRFAALGVGQSAFETFTYTVLDNGELSTATITIEIQGVNDLPTAVDDGFTTDEDSTGTWNVLANDTDIDNGDELTLTVNSVQGLAGNVGVGFTSEQGAQVTISADGTLIYDPGEAFQYLALGESATDTFTYNVNDAHGLASLASATVTITITGADDGVTANNDVYAVDEDKILNGNLITDDTDAGADLNIDTHDLLMIESVDAGTLLGELSIGTNRIVCIRGKITPNGSSQTEIFDADGTTLKNPVVFITPGGISDPEPGAVMVANVTTSSFSYYFKEQKEGGVQSDNDGSTHTNTTELSYMVFDCGEYLLADGTRFEVGKAEISAIYAKNEGTLIWDEVNFANPFGSKPVVINHLQSCNDPDGELFGTRMNNKTNDTGSDNTNRFQIALEEYEGSNGTAAYSETVGWFAIEAMKGEWNNNIFNAGIRTSIKAFDSESPPSDLLQYDEFDPFSFAEPPSLIASLATINGSDPVVLRSGTISTDTYQIFMREDSYADSELNHVDEQATWLAIGGNAPLRAYDITGGVGSFTYNPIGRVNPTSTTPVVESFSYTLRDQHGNTSSATVTITVHSEHKGSLMIIR